MKLARFWTRQPGEAMAPDGRRIRVVARGWSDESPEMAARLARDVAARLAQKIASGDMAKRQYLYGERPLPEAIIREFAGPAGPRALVTRNVYGALVMNAQELMFIDIDREDRPAHSGGDLIAGLKSLFGGGAAPSPAQSVVDDIRRVTEANGLAARVYKTAAGYRVAITNAAFQAGSAQSDALLRQFGADPLYIRLCQLQQSFRARLTPKPWRCGMGAPPVSFPYESPNEEARFREWESRYNRAAASYATCRFLTTFGGVRIAPEFEDLIYEHDQDSKASMQLPLA
jgi:hypothetical protein